MKGRELEAAVIVGLRPSLLAVGFSRKRLSWYRHDRRFLQMLPIDTGERRLIVRLGAVNRKVNKTTHPSIYDCHMTVGMGSLVPAEVDWNSLRTWTDWPPQCHDQLADVVDVLDRFALPVLNQWRSTELILEFFESPLARKCIIRPELKAHLNSG